MHYSCEPSRQNNMSYNSAREIIHRPNNNVWAFTNISTGLERKFHKNTLTKKNMIHFGDSSCRLVGAKAEKQWDYRAFFTSKDSLPKNWQASNLYLPCITSAAGSSNGLPKVPDFSEKVQAGCIPSCNFPMSRCRSAKAEHYTDEFLTCKIKGLVNVVKGPLCRHEVHALHPVPYLENPL